MFILVANPTVFTGLVAKNHLAPSANYVEASGIIRRIPSVQVGRVLIGFFVSRMIRMIFVCLKYGLLIDFGMLQLEESVICAIGCKVYGYLC